MAPPMCNRSSSRDSEEEEEGAEEEEEEVRLREKLKQVANAVMVAIDNLWQGP
jgi:hypothetical protein